MPKATLISQLPFTITSRMTWHAMVADGIDEAPLAVMRFEQYKRLTHGQPMQGLHASVYRSLSAAASTAKARLRNRPHLAEHYAKRMELRSIAEALGLDTPGGRAYMEQVQLTAPTRGRQPALEPVLRVLTPQEQLEREHAAMRELATQLPPNLTRFADSRGEPEFAPRERDPRAVAQRREFASLERRYREAVRFVEAEELAKSRRLEELTAKASAVGAPITAPAAMRGAAYRSLTAPERALHDLIVIASRGRVPPRASAHPLSHVPLHLRRGIG